MSVDFCSPQFFLLDDDDFILVVDVFNEFGFGCNGRDALANKCPIRAVFCSGQYQLYIYIHIHINCHV